MTSQQGYQYPYPPPQGQPGYPPPQGQPGQGPYTTPGQPPYPPAQPPPAYDQYNKTDSESRPITNDMDDDSFNEYSNFMFSEQSVRKGFIKKVYSILMAQLAVTMIFIMLFLYAAPVRNFAAANPWLWILAFVMTIVLLIVLACCPDVRRKHPINLILLGVFTFCEGFLLGAVSASYKADAVLIAVGITAAVCLALTLFAFQTKYDFTMCSGALLVLLVVLLLFGILSIFIRSQVLNILYASLGALVFSLYLVFDTQLMMGGKHKYSLSPEEYIFAALNLYLDIVNLFMFILQLVGAVRN